MGDSQPAGTVDRVDELSGRLGALEERRSELLAQQAAEQGAWRVAVEAGQDAGPHDEALATIERKGLALDREAAHLAGLLESERARLARLALEVSAEQAAAATESALNAYRGAADGYRAVFDKAIADFAAAVKTVCQAQSGLESSRAKYEGALSRHAGVLQNLGASPADWPRPVGDLVERMAQGLMSESPELLHVFQAAVDAGWLASEMGGYLARQIEIQHAQVPGRLDNLAVLARVSEAAVSNAKARV